MNEFKINVFYNNEKETTIENIMIQIFNDYIKTYINNFENNINESYDCINNNNFFVKKTMEKTC